MILFLRIESAGYKGHKDKYDSIPASKQFIDSGRGYKLTSMAEAQPGTD